MLLKKYPLYKDFKSDNSILFPIFSDYNKYKCEAPAAILEYIFWSFLTSSLNNPEIVQNTELFWEPFKKEKQLFLYDWSSNDFAPR